VLDIHQNIDNYSLSNDILTEPEDSTDDLEEKDEETIEIEENQDEDDEEFTPKKKKKYNKQTEIKLSVEERKIKCQENIKKTNKSLLEKVNGRKFTIIYADPPWSYNQCKFFEGTANSHYDTMSIEDLKKLSISQIADKDAILLMWVTGPFIFHAKELMKAWGFTPVTVFMNWIKTYKGKIAGPRLGVYTRGTVEHIVMGKRGNVAKFKYKIAFHYNAHLEDSTEHSKKPKYFKELIDKMFMNVPKIELFARESDNPDWEHWGNESEKFGIHDKNVLEIRNKQFKLQNALKTVSLKGMKPIDKITKKSLKLDDENDVNEFLKKFNE
jgi:N6-adenosine-specific RNA methylase IME4